jgi:hypothetical protein
MKYTGNIYFMCKYPKYDTNMLQRKNSFNILVIINEVKWNPENKIFNIKWTIRKMQNVT